MIIGVTAIGGGGIFLVLAVIFAAVGVMRSGMVERYLAILRGKYSFRGDWALVIVVLVILGAVWSGLTFPAYRSRGYDSDVKSNLKNAAMHQESYFADKGTYTNNVGNLRGFNQSANVKITMQATATTYVITGTRMKGCMANTGIWSFTSTTEAIDGTPCR